MQPKSVLTIEGINKTYANGFQALRDVSLTIYEGEIFALLGPNGAGKTTLIGSVCGTIIPSSGRVSVNGYDIQKDYRQARQCVGLVPQELQTEMFETVWDTVYFTRQLFGLSRNDKFLEDLLKRLSLWDKRKDKIRTLSGGMKRRVMIAKALSHEPKVLFLDEPSAGVDVELRKSLWIQVEDLRKSGVTIILTTHYIEEAELMADRIGIINHGEIILTETKDDLMRQMCNKQILFTLEEQLNSIPKALSAYNIEVSNDKKTLIHNAEMYPDNDTLPNILAALKESGIKPIDINVSKKNLEDIFVEMVERK